MKERILLTLSFLSSFLFASCLSSVSIEKDFEYTKFKDANIPVETALDSLDLFLAEIDSPMSKGAQRRIASIDTLSNHRYMAYLGEPDAYLVNFENEQGFAILGATSGVTPIIAFIERGNISWDDILQSGDNAIYTSANPLKKRISPEQVLNMCVNGALYGNTDESDDCSVVCPRLAPITTGLDFNQSATYCLNYLHSFVVNGCAATALSIAVAHNNFPTIYADYELLNMSNCTILDGSGYKYEFSDDRVFLTIEDYFSNPLSIPTSLSQSQMIALIQKVDPFITIHGIPETNGTMLDFYRTRYKLTSSLFYYLNHCCPLKVVDDYYKV